MGEIGWSDLPEELVGLIANRLSNNIELCSIRSICKPWRSAVAPIKPFRNRFGHDLTSLSFWRRTRLSPTTFYRVTLPSSCSSKGWLIRTRQVSISKKNKLVFPLSRLLSFKGRLIKVRQVSKSQKNNFLSPLSHHLITPSEQTLDLLKFAVSEIRQSHEIENVYSYMSPRVVFVDNMVFAVGGRKNISCCKKGEEKKGWTTITRQVEELWGTNEVDFSDIILHRGHVYALDLNGVIWWISLSQLSSVQYAPSTPLEYYEIDSCNEKRLVEYCGDLCIVHRFYKIHRVKGEKIEETIGFKVYKMDDLAKWVKVSSLGDKALIVAVDSCFTVVASEYYGCLSNSIYFTEIESEEEKCRRGKKVEDLKVFKLDDESIISMTDSSNSQSYFQMFSPPFF
ncbi:putative F-box protein [Cardamine amara subsp. amara]|uniref:F-box protein n=1 Tax=Cardamine amara subsp. amara TaxID=228776 RepID=A0ABD0ZDB8_CARAN